MPLQPIFPEPITVRHNVAEARHRLRVRFVRRVVLGHFLSSLFLGGCVAFLPIRMPVGLSSALFLVGLVALSMQRRTLNGGVKDNVLSIAVLGPTLFFLANTLHHLQNSGWPLLVFVPISLGLGLYALFCGNDFSYSGQFVLCSVATLLSLLGLWAAHVYAPWQVLVGSLIAFTYLFYFVYDLSMLVKRRRFGEEPAAVADLYRDLLNFMTYSVRVYFHWRKFRFI